MPGHKRNPAFLPPDLARFDYTEIPGFDNLRRPDGIIKKALERAALIWGADETFFSVNGATGAMSAAVWAAAASPRGAGRVVLARNCHVSAYSGLVMSGALPEYIQPESFGAERFAGGVCPQAVERALVRSGGASAVVIVSPTYEGVVSDVAAIAQVCHSRGALLIVDEAHGSHFPFSDAFPRSAVSCGADIVVNSPHKTLPALTQTALLHVRGGLADRAAIDRYLSLIQTTSPSYILMADLDWILEKLSADREIFDEYAITLKEFRQSLYRYLTSPPGAVRLLGRGLVGEAAIYDMDISKLYFAVNADGFLGYDAERELAEKHGVQVESSGPSCLTFLTSVADTREGFERMFAGITALRESLRTAPPRPTPDYRRIPPIAMKPRDALAAPKDYVSLTKAVGRVSGGFIAAYPPGSPILVPGEVIDAETIDILMECVRERVNIIGQPRLESDGLIETVKGE
jgi:arginine/lysine/ornithine decarboxylase